MCAFVLTVRFAQRSAIKGGRAYELTSRIALNEEANISQQPTTPKTDTNGSRPKAGRRTTLGNSRSSTPKNPCILSPAPFDPSPRGPLQLQAVPPQKG